MIKTGLACFGEAAHGGTVHFSRYADGVGWVSFAGGTGYPNQTGASAARLPRDRTSRRGVLIAGVRMAKHPDQR